MSQLQIVVAVVCALVVLVGRWGWRRAAAARRLPGAVPAAVPDNPLRAALARTRDAFSAVFARERLDPATWDALEEALLRADVGAHATGRLLGELREGLPAGATPESARVLLREKVRERLTRRSCALVERPASGPFVILVVGVNGSGKTTSIGKLAARFTREGASVVLGAGDTFRAGAIDQLKVWGERAAVPVIAHQEGADPAAVIHDTLQAAVARGHQVVLADTAGRLQAQRQLMDELGKVKRVCGKVVPGAPHEVLLVIDATMGQNALSQARLFGETAGVTGIVLTKLDGTAKGGVVIAIADELGLPVKFVGVGERIDDLRPFDPNAFAEGLFAAG
jgi:fused signal recognition particle receptor